PNREKTKRLGPRRVGRAGGLAPQDQHVSPTAAQDTQPLRGEEPMHRVVVTGIGVVSPNGIGRREFGEAIVEGRSGVSSIESFDTAGQAIKIAGEIKNFNVMPFLGEHKKSAKLMSRAVG